MRLKEDTWEACTIGLVMSRHVIYVVKLSKMLNSLYSCLKASIGWSREALNAG